MTLPGTVVNHKLLGVASGQIRETQRLEEEKRLRAARTRREREDSRRRLGDA